MGRGKVRKMVGRVAEEREIVVGGIVVGNVVVVVEDGCFVVVVVDIELIRS